MAFEAASRAIGSVSAAFLGVDHADLASAEVDAGPDLLKCFAKELGDPGSIPVASLVRLWP
jgi:hypothetical protein